MLSEQQNAEPMRTVGDSVAAAAQVVMSRYQDRVAEGLRAAVELLPSEVTDPSRYHLGLQPGARPGKALRPTLTMLIAEGLGGIAEWAQRLGVAVQLIHDFSLVHDDIVDEDRSRRGQPALWVRSGMPTALNTGDALLTAAFLTLSRSGAPAPLIQIAADRLGAATLEMVGGQQADIEATGKPPAELSAYLRMIDLKTGALLGAAAALGAIAAGASREVVAACETFGRTLGIAFQLRDDTLGVFGDSETTGKPVGNDLLRRKQGLPLLLALGCKGDLGRAARSWLEPDGLSGATLPDAVQLLHECGVATRCEGLTTTWTEKALGAAAHLPLEARVGEEVEQLCRWLGERWS
ncbi:MAG TPA: polyprenyl synthetase family protein [Candidatus Dormibacteraeota bacterium]|nr:polyprenyl synthetase family protein [Candidatus Dormibacteraeota bacterium]